MDNRTLSESARTACRTSDPYGPPAFTDTMARARARGVQSLLWVLSLSRVLTLPISPVLVLALALALALDNELRADEGLMGVANDCGCDCGCDCDCDCGCDCAATMSLPAVISSIIRASTDLSAYFKSSMVK